MKLFVMTVFLVATNAFAYSNMECKNAIAVLYEPGQNWTEFEKYFPGHMNYLERNMKSGEILLAGPFNNKGNIDGGLTIYKSVDVEKIQALLKQDMFVNHNVVIATIKPWWMCNLVQGN